MAEILPESLVKAFADAVTSAIDNVDARGERTAYGTVKIADDRVFAILDSSDVMTPCASTVIVNTGDRVLVLLKNRSAIIIGKIVDAAPKTFILGDSENYLAVDDDELLISHVVNAEKEYYTKSEVDKKLDELRALINRS